MHLSRPPTHLLLFMHVHTHLRPPTFVFALAHGRRHSFALVRALHHSFVLVHARRRSFLLVCAHLCSLAPVCAHSYLPALAQIPALVPTCKPSTGAGTGLRLSYPQSNSFPQCRYGFLPGMGTGMATDTRRFTPAVPCALSSLDSDDCTRLCSMSRSQFMLDLVVRAARLCVTLYLSIKARPGSGSSWTHVRSRMVWISRERPSIPLTYKREST